MACSEVLEFLLLALGNPFVILKNFHNRCVIPIGYAIAFCQADLDIID